MTIVKSYIKLTPASGNTFTGEISPRQITGFGCYVIDGSFTHDPEMHAPDMSGEDFQQMQDIVFRSEFSDLTKQSTPLFFFAKSKTFCMNFIKPYLTVTFPNPTAACGLFQPATVSIYDGTFDPIIGETNYNGSPVYIYVDTLDRTGGIVDSYNQRGTIAVADPSKYGYDIDSKLATKTLDITGTSTWQFGKLQDSQKTSLHSTADNVFKFMYTENRSHADIKGLSALALSSQRITDTESSVQINKQYSGYGCAYIPPNSISVATRFYYGITTETLAQKIAVPAKYIYKQDDSESFLLTRSLTPQAITQNTAHIAHTMNIYGLGEILQLNDQKTSVKSVGTVYTASGLVGDDDRSRNGYWVYPTRFVANESDLSGKTAIIKVDSGTGMTIASEKDAYKVILAASYFVLTSKAGTKTQQDQRFLYDTGSTNTKYLEMSGFLQCVTGANGSPLTDDYTVGITCISSGSASLKVYVLYDDNTVAISNYELAAGGTNSGFTFPMLLSPDGKNLRVHTDYLSKTFVGGGTVRNTLAPNSPADGEFAVQENTGNKKIVAAGIVSIGDVNSSNSIYPVTNLRNDGVYLVLEPKT